MEHTNRLYHHIRMDQLHLFIHHLKSLYLPLLVLIRGGPYRASLNGFGLIWYQWAIMAASEG